MKKHASHDVIAALGPRHAEAHAHKQDTEVRTKHSAKSLQEEKMIAAVTHLPISIVTVSHVHAPSR